MSTHYISRRHLLAAAGGSALVLAGCGSSGLPFVPGTPNVDPGDPGGGGTTPPGQPPQPTVAAQAETVYTMDVDGSMFEIDPLGHRVARLGGGGVVLWQTRPGDLNCPRALAVDSHGNVCVANHGDSTIVVYDAVGTRLTELGGYGDEPGRFRYVPDLAFDSEDQLHVVDAYNHRIQVLDGNGDVVRAFGELGDGAGQLNGPRALAFDTSGNLHVLDAGNCRIEVFSPEGQPLYEYGTWGSGDGEFLNPSDLAIDAWDRVYVTDPGMRRVLVFEDAGHGAISVLEPVDEAGEPVTPVRVELGPDGGLLLSVRPFEMVPAGA